MKAESQRSELSNVVERPMLLQQGGTTMKNDRSGMTKEKEIHPFMDGSFRQVGESSFSVPGGTDNILSQHVAKRNDFHTFLVYMAVKKHLTLVADYPSLCRATGE